MDKKDGNGWEVRRQKMYDLINYEQWDLFCAQEVLHNQIEDLKANLDGYNYVGSGQAQCRQTGNALYKECPRGSQGRYRQNTHGS